jgi:hypothetical protein
MRWMGHVACMREMRNVYTILVGKPEEKNHLEDLGIDRRIILKWIFEFGMWNGSIWLRIVTGSGLL